MNDELTYRVKVQRLPWALTNQTLNAVSAQITFGGPVLLLFLDSLGLTKAHMGLLLACFPLSSLIALAAEPFAARFGNKRTYLTFYSIRTLVLALLLAVPGVIYNFGALNAVVFISLVLVAFAVLRAVASTGFSPWYQEFVPNATRSRYALIYNLVSNIAGTIALVMAAFMIGPEPGMGPFLWIIGAGVALGLAAGVCAFPMPGGAPIAERRKSVSLGAMLDTLHTREFSYYLAGIALITLGSAPLQFIPLLMKHRIGLPDNDILIFSAITLTGNLLFSYLWSWATDRWGNKAIIMLSLGVLAVMPLAWLAIPAASPLTIPLAIAVSIMAGLSSAGWSIGSVGLLFNGVVAPERKTDFLAANYAWSGLVGGLGVLVAGGALDLVKSSIQVNHLPMPDEYTVLFPVAFLISVTSILVFRQVREYKAFGLRRLLTMLLKGNPIRAAGSLIMYRRARAESERISVTESMGSAKSPLNIDELLDAMYDPSFNVRHEAIIAMARMRADDRLINALTEVLHGNEPDLSVSAIWALGRLGDRRAIEPLRELLDSAYPLIRARSARTLALLGDYDIVPNLLDKFRSTEDEGLRIAYATALGALRSRDAVAGLLEFLHNVRGKDAHMELALAIAQIASTPDNYVHLARQVRLNPTSAFSQALLGLRRLRNLPPGWLENTELVDHCISSFARYDQERGLLDIAAILDRCQPVNIGETYALILRECAECVREFKSARTEYAVLGLHILRAAIEL